MRTPGAPEWIRELGSTFGLSPDEVDANVHRLNYRLLRVIVDKRNITAGLLLEKMHEREFLLALAARAAEEANNEHGLFRRSIVDAAVKLGIEEGRAVRFVVVACREAEKIYRKNKKDKTWILRSSSRFFWVSFQRQSSMREHVNDS